MQISKFTRLSDMRPGFSSQTAISLAAAALLFALMAAAAPTAMAQSPYAPGGLFVHPTAYTPRSHHFSLYSAAFTQDEQNGSNESYYPLSLTYTPIDALQVSGIVAYHNGRNEPPHTHIGGFLKYQLVPDSPTHPAFAIAGSYVGHDFLETSAAAIASHAFIKNGRIVTTLHSGVKWGRTSDEHGGGDDFGAFIGAQVPVGTHWSLVGETSTKFKFERAPASSVGVMYHTARGPDLSIGLVNTGRSSRMKFFFGVGFPIGH